MGEDPARPGGPPPSDVSAGVGLVGLAGLFAWLMICRSWPGIADAFALPGPHQRMAGELASLVAVVFSGIPMLLWSIFVDKVHRNPSTGIDWSRRRPLSETSDISITKLAGIWATWALIGFIYCVARWYWDGQYLFAMKVMGYAVLPLAVLSVPYVLWLDRYLVRPRDHNWHFGAMLIGREAWEPGEVKHHLRSWAVKGFFIAFMISILPFGWNKIVLLEPAQIMGDPVAVCTALIEVLFLIDVQIAMVGYLVTLRPFDAHIRSANPHVQGWLAALICYPPFILMGGGAPLDYHPNTADWSVWLAGHTTILWLWGALLIVLTAIYAWATVAFGIRFSNLTYRGVVTNGPYRYTRHPAYISKNAFWWCSTMPFIATSHSLTDVVRNTTVLALVSAVYFWRAKTEEKHLLAEDPKYRAYHAWMEENALITRTVSRFLKAITPRNPQP